MFLDTQPRAVDRDFETAVEYLKKITQSQETQIVETMSLYTLTPDKLIAVPPTSFAVEKLLERADLQRVLKADISPLGEDLMVIAEEHGEWEDSRRRIDLLCLSKAAELVVVEIKRTEDGGHMELQALRYAAMISSMTMAQVVEAHARDSGKDFDEARRDITEFLDRDIEDDVTGDVRIILVAANFSTELTTTVLWLNKRDINITCVRLIPYRSGDTVLIDATQIIPLPEATDYEVKLRAQEKEKRQAKNTRHATRQRFWSRLIERSKSRTPILANRSATDSGYLPAKIGRSGFTLYLCLVAEHSSVECSIRLPQGKVATRNAFHALLAQKQAIETQFGEPLEWEELEDRIACTINSYEEGGWKSPEEEWPAIQDRLIDKLSRLESALKEPIRQLKL